MRICVVSSNFPSQLRPWAGTFVHKLCTSWVTLGAKVLVISPTSIWYRWRESGMENTAKHDSDQDTGIRVLRPKWLSAGNIGLGKWRSLRASMWTFKRTILAQIAEVSEFTPDLCYGHFLFPSGVGVRLLAEKLSRPVFLALGESQFLRYERVYKKEIIGAELKKFCGVVTVSAALKELCCQHYGLADSRVFHCPNGVDVNMFLPRDRVTARRRLGLPCSAKIGIFVGHFDNRKGAMRTAAAMARVKGVHGIFIGSGPDEPTGQVVIFKGRVRHEEMPWYFAAADFMVLPSLQEGMSNAILEAMACGLPVIASNIPSNKEFLDDTSAFLVEPDDVSALSHALTILVKESALAERMGRSGREIILQNYTLQKRADSILSFMVEKVNSSCRIIERGR